MKKFRLEDVQINDMLMQDGQHMSQVIYKSTGHTGEATGYISDVKNRDVSIARLRTTLEEAGIVKKETRIDKPQVKTLLTMSKLILLCQKIDHDNDDLRGISSQLCDSVNRLIKSVDLEVDNSTTPNLEQGVIEDVVGVMIDAIRIYVKLYNDRREIPPGNIGLLSGLFNTIDKQISIMNNKN